MVKVDDFQEDRGYSLWLFIYFVSMREIANANASRVTRDPPNHLLGVPTICPHDGMKRCR